MGTIEPATWTDRRTWARTHHSCRAASLASDRAAFRFWHWHGRARITRQRAPIPFKLTAMVGPPWFWSAWRRPDRGDSTMAHALTPPLRQHLTRVPPFQYLLLSLVAFTVL